MKLVKLVMITIMATCASMVVLAEKDDDAIARVIVTIGDVQAISGDQDARDLERRDAIYENDTIKTEKDSHVKIRFEDNTVLALDPNSEFLIEEYQFDQKGSDENKYLGKLVKGGFMVVTGAVANKDKANFKVDSELLGLTVRGTCFGGTMSESFQFSETNCGAVQVDNKYGSVLVGPKQARSLVVSGQDGSLLTAQDQAQVGMITQCEF